ncbi:MAG: TipAS antibiotic-recognition domain-containing protein [bacterium]|nr:TipAS antibiotic-recognition domain-containing protein [bacterium]
MTEIERHKAKYAQEVREKYGEKAVECEQRTAGYTKQDWAAIMSKWDVIFIPEASYAYIL